MEQENGFIDKINRIVLKKKHFVDITDGDLARRINGLQSDVGYYFKNIGLLLHALTHKSAIVPETDNTGLGSNERLELLGDSVLDFLVAEELYHRYPQYPEGRISEIKSLLVSRKVIGQVAAQINLMNAIIVGKSYEKLKNLKTDVSSNAFEALLAAIYLDGGMNSVRKILKKKLFPNIEQLLETEENINYKALVLEYAQGRGNFEVKYNTVSESGPDHDKTFTVEIEINDEKFATASGGSKKKAEQRAARIAAEKMGLLTA